MTTRTVQFYCQGYSTPPAEGLTLTPCTIVATIGGNVVFSGPVSTLESSDILRLPTDQTVLFTCEIPLVTTGNAYTIPVSLDITGDDVYLEQINANYCRVNNPVFTSEQITILNDPATTPEQSIVIYEPVANPPLTPEEVTYLSTTPYPASYPTLVAHNLTTTVSTGASDYNSIIANSELTDARSNVVITNATYSSPPPPDPRPPDADNTWGWEIETAPGQTSNMTFLMNVSPGQDIS